MQTEILLIDKMVYKTSGSFGSLPSTYLLSFGSALIIKGMQMLSSWTEHAMISAGHINARPHA